MKSACRILAIASAVLAGIGTAIADSSIRVLVNDKAITSYDISQRSKLMRISGEKGGEKAAIESLIDEAIEVQEATRRGFTVSDGRLDGAYAGIAQGMKFSPKQLDKALASEGIVPETLKRRIRAQMLWTQLIQVRARFETSVKSSDIVAALAKEKPEELTSTEYTLQQIIFVVPRGSSGGFLQQRRREAEAFRGRYGGCDGAIGQAKKLRDVTVRSLGRRTTSELVGKEGEEIQHTPVGKTTRPRTIEVGVELVAVCATRKLAGDSSARSEVENKLMFEQGQGVGKDYLKELRGKAVIKYR